MIVAQIEILYRHLHGMSDEEHVTSVSIVRVWYNFQPGTTGIQVRSITSCPRLLGAEGKMKLWERHTNINDVAGA